MNSLSWLIYLGSVSDSFSTLFGILAGLCALVTMAGAFFLAFGSMEEVAEAHTLGASVLKIALPAFLTLAIVACALPSKDTVYAIAASEMGERAISNPAVTDLSREALATLKDWLQQQRKHEK